MLPGFTRRRNMQRSRYRALVDLVWQRPKRAARRWAGFAGTGTNEHVGIYSHARMRGWLCSGFVWGRTGRRGFCHFVLGLHASCYCSAQVPHRPPNGRARCRHCAFIIIGQLKNFDHCASLTHLELSNPSNTRQPPPISNFIHNSRFNNVCHLRTRAKQWCQWHCQRRQRCQRYQRPRGLHRRSVASQPPYHTQEPIPARRRFLVKRQPLQDHRYVIAQLAGRLGCERGLRAIAANSRRILLTGHSHRKHTP
jgi:hypothetical protein